MLQRFLTLLLFIFPLPSFCQDILVSGTIIDKDNKQKIEFANVVVLKLADSSIVKGTVTDRKGKFEISGLAPGKYFLQSTFIGYEKSLTTFSINANQPKQNLVDVTFTSFIVAGRK